MPGKRKRTFLSQNFLADEEVARSIVDSFQVGQSDHVLEIGAGRGALTVHLLGRCEKLTLVEKDRRLCHLLESKFGKSTGVELIHSDFLEVDLSRLRGSPASAPLRVIGAIPYHITTPLLFHLLEYPDHVSDALLVVQKEVALRLTSGPGKKTYGALSVAVQYRADTKLLFPVPKECFRPRPKVDSQAVHLVMRREPPVRPKDPSLFFFLVRNLFTKRRKQIQKSLKTDRRFSLTKEDLGRIESSSGIPLSKRPEDLSLEEFCRLSDALGERLEGAAFFHNTEDMEQ
jgi:16S rRNA (adenine1518-N6/adenine1519-N6)-dimethyltransferase